MSDKFKIIAIGGAGANNIPSAFTDKSYVFTFSNFTNIQTLKENISRMERTDKTIIICSPAGMFSSSILPEVLRSINAKGEKIIFLSIEPFSNESPDRRRRANETIKNIKRYIDTLIRIENDNFVTYENNYSWNEMLTRINNHIANLVKGLINMNEDLPDEKEIGLYHSEGKTIEDLQKNIIFSNSKPAEGMIGTATVRNEDDLRKIVESMPLEILSYKLGNKFSISGALLYSKNAIPYIQEIPSAPGIRIR